MVIFPALASYHFHLCKLKAWILSAELYNKIFCLQKEGFSCKLINIILGHSIVGGWAGKNSFSCRKRFLTNVFGGG
jgi:hypothetical protein